MTAADVESPPRAGWRDWVGLIALTLPIFMSFTDMTVLFLAAPAIAADLAPTTAQLLWILHIGEFVAAGLILTMGRLTDLVGRRRLLMIGVGIYGVVSLVAAFSTSAEMLIAMRALLGVATAILMPSAVGLVRAMFRDSKQFAVAFAILMTTGSVAMALGPPLGGLLLEFFWWGSVFIANVPPAFILLIAAPFFLPASREVAPGRIDARSVALSLTAIMAVVYGIQQSADQGMSPMYVASILLGLVLGYFFVRRQRRIDDPLLDPRILTRAGVPVALLTLFLTQLAFGANDMLVTQHLQVMVGLSPARVGGLMVAPAVAAISATLLVPVLLRALRPAFVIALALGVGVLGGVTAIAGLAIEAVALIVVGLSLASVAAAVTVTVSSQLVVSRTPEEQTGSAAAVNDVSSGIGFASGLAFVGSLGLGLYAAMLGRAAPAGLSEGDLRTAQESAGGVAAVAERIPDSLSAELMSAANEAMTMATQSVFALGIVLASVAAGMVLWRLRHARLD